MLLGKRPRGPMRRTTSMTGINVDLVEELEPCDDQNNHAMMNGHEEGGDRKRSVVAVAVGGPSSGFDHRGLMMPTTSPICDRRGGFDRSGGGNVVHVETAHFLRTCGLCNRRLKPGRDIYMYRGDTAFCSQECREQQMKHDERKEKCSVAAHSKKDENHHHHHHHHHHRHTSAPATTTSL